MKGKRTPTKNTPKNTLKRNSRLLLVPCLIAVQAIFQLLFSSNILPTVVWQLQRHGYPRVNPYVAMLFFASEECSFPVHFQVAWESSLFVSVKPSSSDKWRTVPAFSISNLNITSPYLNPIFFLFQYYFHC